MSREVDRRPATKGGTIVTSARESLLESAAEEVSRALPGEQRVRIARMDPTTGNPATLAVDEAPAEEGNYVARALAHAQAVKGALGFAAEQPAEFAPDPNVQKGVERSSGRPPPAALQGHPGLRGDAYGAVPAPTARLRSPSAARLLSMSLARSAPD